MQSEIQTTQQEPSVRELTLRGMILGAIITVIFTASNVYLGLKVGLTFASSIPAAVISMAVLKVFHDASILENNMVQTQASAAGTLSSVIFVLPGLLMMGYWQGFPFLQTLLICTAGGILGVIFTIPLRHVMVVKSSLPYPEGVAAAEILHAGSHKEGDTGIREIIGGGFLAAIVSFCTNGLRIISDSASYWFKAGSTVFQIPMGFSLALLGAGYLVGIVGGFAILLGIFLAWGVGVPYFTSNIVIPDGLNYIDFAQDLWKTKVRFVGVGTLGIAAIWTLLTLMKPMTQGMVSSFRALQDKEKKSTDATETDLSPRTMIAITLSAIALIVLALSDFIHEAPISTTEAVILVIVCTTLAVMIGFFVAAACGYMAGLVGSSSSPISGIGIISVVIIALTLTLIGKFTGLMDSQAGQNFLIALTIFTGATVVSTAAISNDNLQDLKTGLLVKATPWKQQVALIVGCIVGALVIAPVLSILYNAYGFSGALPRPNMDPADALSAPQATLMTFIAKGIFSSSLEWTYIYMGIGLGVTLIIMDILIKRISNNRLALPALAVGMGIYLPPSINMPIVVGAILAWLINRHLTAHAKRTHVSSEKLHQKSERFGTLFAAGLIVGESLIGVLMAFIIAASVTTGGSESPLAIQISDWKTTANLLGLAVFIIGIAIFAQRVLRAKK